MDLLNIGSRGGQDRHVTILDPTTSATVLDSDWEGHRVHGFGIWAAASAPFQDVDQRNVVIAQNSNVSKLSRIRARRNHFGMAQISCWMCLRRITWPNVFPCFFAMQQDDASDPFAFLAVARESNSTRAAAQVGNEHFALNHMQTRSRSGLLPKL